MVIFHAVVVLFRFICSSWKQQ